jgi:putative transposase
MGRTPSKYSNTGAQVVERMQGEGLIEGDVGPLFRHSPKLEVRSLHPPARAGPGGAMKKSRFTEEQVIYAQRLAESGTLVTDVSRQMGISEATFYVWKKKYASLGVAELRQLRQLQEENGRLKRLVADLTLDKQILSEVIRKKI